MKKVTAFIGSARKKNTYHAVLHFLNDLQAHGEIEYEIVTLSDYNLNHCRGCGVCIWKGEQFCPLKDDRDVLLGKIMASDGVIFASPNYNGHVSGIMKTFIDRFAFICHRPRYFGKACTSIVTYSFAKGDKIAEYLDILAMALGFNVVKGISVNVEDPGTEKEQRKLEQAHKKHVEQFYAMLESPSYPEPSLLMLMVFRYWRGAIRKTFKESTPDYHYYAERGWLESDYYYPTRLGLFKKAVGKFYDSMAGRRSLA